MVTKFKIKFWLFCCFFCSQSEGNQVKLRWQFGLVLIQFIHDLVHPSFWVRRVGWGLLWLGRLEVFFWVIKTPGNTYSFSSTFLEYLLKLQRLCTKLANCGLNTTHIFLLALVQPLNHVCIILSVAIVTLFSKWIPNFHLMYIVISLYCVHSVLFFKLLDINLKFSSYFA